MRNPPAPFIPRFTYCIKFDLCIYLVAIKSLVTLAPRFACFVPCYHFASIHAMSVFASSRGCTPVVPLPLRFRIVAFFYPFVQAIIIVFFFDRYFLGRFLARRARAPFLLRVRITGFGRRTCFGTDYISPTGNKRSVSHTESKMYE